MAVKKGLGKGLDSLIPNSVLKPVAQEKTTEDNKEKTPIINKEEKESKPFPNPLFGAIPYSLHIKMFHVKHYNSLLVNNLCSKCHICFCSCTLWIILNNW